MPSLATRSAESRVKPMPITGTWNRCMGSTVGARCHAMVTGALRRSAALPGVDAADVEVDVVRRRLISAEVCAVLDPGDGQRDAEAAVLAVRGAACARVEA